MISLYIITLSTSCPFVQVAQPVTPPSDYRYSNEMNASLGAFDYLHSFSADNFHHDGMIPFNMVYHLAVKACMKRSHAYNINYHLSLSVHARQASKTKNDMKIKILICLTPITALCQKRSYNHHLTQTGVVASSSWSTHKLFLNLSYLTFYLFPKTASLKVDC
jgi:hypothetical protein